MNRSGFGTIAVRVLRSMAIAAAVALGLAGAAFAADVEGSGDHPMVSRYPEAAIVGYGREAFDEYRLLTGPVDKPEPGESKLLEGKITRITYEIPKTRSALEVFRNYEQSLAEAGFETLYGCSDDACGGRDFNQVVIPYHGMMTYQNEGQRYLAARLPRAEGDVYVMLYVVKASYSIGGPRKDNVFAQLDVIEVAPMETGMITVDAEAMAEDIDAKGSVALYGILFDTDSATIKPESAGTLEEIARLLDSRPELGLLVVGHTDNQGSLEYNLDLSARRAAAVVEALTSGHGIAAGRLEPHGVGFLAPVAANDSEAGRQQNRRVELVKR